MAKNTLQLVILTQERELLRKEVASVTVDTTTGQITVLPEHIPLFSKLSTGELVYRWTEGTSKKSDVFAISGGFVDVSPDGEVTVLADYALRADAISVEQAQEARRRAEEAMQNKESEQQFRLAEASLRKALNELRVAQRRQKSGGPQI